MVVQTWYMCNCQQSIEKFIFKQSFADRDINKRGGGDFKLMMEINRGRTVFYAWASCVKIAPLPFLLQIAYKIKWNTSFVKKDDATVPVLGFLCVSSPRFIQKVWFQSILCLSYDVKQFRSRGQ